MKIARTKKQCVSIRVCSRADWSGSAPKFSFKLERSKLFLARSEKFVNLNFHCADKKFLANLREGTRIFIVLSWMRRWFAMWFCCRVKWCRRQKRRWICRRRLTQSSNCNNKYSFYRFVGSAAAHAVEHSEWISSASVFMTLKNWRWCVIVMLLLIISWIMLFCVPLLSFFLAFYIHMYIRLKILDTQVKTNFFLCN